MNKKTQPKISPIEELVMSKIKKGEVHMKPHSYYILLGILSILSVSLLGFIAAYFMSIATLWTRIEVAQGPAYGAKQNLANMLGTFPWWALLLGALSLFCIIYFVKKIGPLYKVRLVYLVPIIIALFVAVGFIFSYSTLPQMFNNHQQNLKCATSDIGCRPLGNGYTRNRQ